MAVQHDRPWMKQYPEGVDLDFNIPEVNLYSLLEDTAEEFSTRTAIIFEDERLTFHELKEQVDRLAGAWHHLGAEKGNRIGLMVSNHPAYVISYYASLKLGMSIVQINPMYTKRELTEIFQDSEITILVAEPGAIEKVSYRIQNIFLTEKKLGYQDIYELIKQYPPLTETYSADAKKDVAVIQYTGGTTGIKKGAMLTHYNIMANVLQSKALYGSTMKFGEETILTAIPLYHVYGMTSGMNLGIYIGAANVLVDKFDIEKILNLIQTNKPTFFPGVPKMYNAFVHYPGIENVDLSCFKMCTSGSAPLPVEIIKQFESLTGVSIGEGYGLSETSPSTHRNPPGGTWKIGSIGIPMPKTDCRIVDDSGQDLPTQAIGELIIKGPQVMLGYWNKTEETEMALRDGWLYTGDLATMDEDGYFYIVGRKKEMIIVGGFNVYPQEIEAVLYEHPDIEEAAVAGIPDPAFGEMVKAFVVPKKGRNMDVQQLKEYCYQQLTRYKVPKQFEIRESLPRNTVGKLLKRILIEESKEGRK